MAPQLPQDEVRRLLDDHRLVLVERREFEALLADLERSLRSVRSILNRLHALLTTDERGSY
jgi:hypothetical protein